MTPPPVQPARPWRRLAPLTVLVLAVHLALLVGEGRGVGPVRREAVHLVARTITPPPPAPAPPPAARPPAPAPAPSPSPRPKPEPQVARQLAPAPAPAAPVETETPPAAAPAPVTAPPASEPAAATLPAKGFALLGPRKLLYVVSIETRDGTRNGEATLDWRQDGSTYEATLEIFGKDLPSRVQRSVGAVTAEGLAPSYFSDKTRSEQATHFERDKGTVVFSNNQPQAQITPGLQDRLSLLLQLAATVAADPERFTPGTLVNVPTATTREVDNWVFSVEEVDELVLAGDAVPALKLQRLPLKEFDQKIELWLATRMDYAPVRVRLTNPNGDVTDQRWFSTDRR